MKKLMLFTSIFLANNCLANELHNFNEIRNAVLTGSNIHIVIDFAKCSPSLPPKASLTGVFVPKAIVVSNEHLATSLTHFTLNNPAFPQKPVYEFVDYKITNANDLILSTQILDAVNYAPLSVTHTLGCKLENGAKVYT